MAAHLRGLFVTHGGHLGAHGSVSYLFARTGVLTYAPILAAVQLTELALAAGAEDVHVSPGAIEILTDPEDFEAVQEALGAAGFVALSAQITQRPATTIELSGEAAQAMQTFLAGLGTLHEVQGVYTNARFS